MTEDVWAKGEVYEAYVGRWSRQVARAFVPWLAPASGEVWVDVGCGTGELTRAVLDLADPSTIIGVDPSDGFLAHARARTADPRARFEVGDGASIPLADATADAAVAGLVINFLPDAAAGVAEMIRTTRPGGTVAGYVWDYAGEMQFMRHFWDAAALVDPESPDEGTRFPICAPKPLRDLFDAAGLHDIATTAIDIPTHFADWDDFWMPFMGGQGAAPAYLARLDPARQEAIRERVRSTVPFAPDGSIPMIARAWAVRGRVHGG